MNQLSWLIYLASVVSSISFLSAIVALFACISFIAGGMTILHNPDDDAYDNPKRARGASMVRWGCTVFGVCALLMIVMPGRDTVYAIAASEMGEELLNSETGSKAVQALDAWLDRQIDPPEEPAD